MNLQGHTALVSSGKRRESPQRTAVLTLWLQGDKGFTPHAYSQQSVLPAWSTDKDTSGFRGTDAQSISNVARHSGDRTAVRPSRHLPLPSSFVSLFLALGF